MSGDEVAKAFVQHYYQTWNTNPDALAGLYQPTSTLTFNGNASVTGPAAIVEALKVRPPSTPLRFDYVL